jgi:peptidoglycan/LPS O-acetylase OafA/YrhL
MPGARHGAGHTRPAHGPRLDFLDGLRGLAALYVVLHHAAMEVPGASLSRGAVLTRGLLRSGHFAVAVFIVLSGFCLMRPVAGDPSGHLRGGTIGYLGRRARRILPPYYAALALCWLLIALFPGLQRPEHARWDRALPAFEPGVVVSHLLLCHNLDERWIFRVDPPLWSVATEWQIYLLFPVLLALWRRHGIASALAAGFAIGNGVAALSGWLDQPALGKLCPWYAGLFALGMAGAVRVQGESAPGPGRGRGSGRSCLLAAALGVIALFLAGLAARHGVDATTMFVDLLVGVSATCLIVRRARRPARDVVTSGRGLLRLLESRPTLVLGSFSYSLYLIHFPLLALQGRLLRDWGWPEEDRYWALLLVATPLCVLAAFLFHLAFERRTVPGPAPRGVAAQREVRMGEPGSRTSAGGSTLEPRSGRGTGPGPLYPNRKGSVWRTQR